MRCWWKRERCLKHLQQNISGAKMSEVLASWWMSWLNEMFKSERNYNVEGMIWIKCLKVNRITMWKNNSNWYETEHRMNIFQSLFSFKSFPNLREKNWKWIHVLRTQQFEEVTSLCFTEWRPLNSLSCWFTF